jgi:site-specific recombinase XerD
VIARSPSTVASIHSALNGLFSWLYLEGEIDANPMLRIMRPRRPRPEDVAIVTVSRAEVKKMLAGSRDGRSSSASLSWLTPVSVAIQPAGCGGVTSTWWKG